MSELEPPQMDRGEQAIPPAPESSPQDAAQSSRTFAPPPALPPPPPRKSRAGTFFLGAFSGCAIVLVGLFILAVIAAAMGSDSTDVSFAAEKVAVIPIEGEILEARETLDALK